MGTGCLMKPRCPRHRAWRLLLTSFKAGNEVINVIPILEKVNSDAQIRGAAIAREIWLKRICAQNLYFLNAEARAEGIAEGKLEVIKNMLNKNIIDLETISEVTGLTKERNFRSLGLTCVYNGP